MEISNEGIDELAEQIIVKYSASIPINPLEIAEKANIEVIEGSRKDYPFKGLIRRQGGKFYIILNMHLLNNINYSICRYTLSHELGHYFLSHHRKKLSKGESIAFTGKDSKNPIKKQLEDQAQQFAASLLMPKSQFIKRYKEIENIGFDAIIDLKRYFNVSITSAFIRFTHLNLEPTMSILWNDNDGIINKSVSKSFQELIDSETIGIKLNKNRPKLEEERIENLQTGIRYFRHITPLSSWVFNIDKDLANSTFVIEETFYCNLWNLTLIKPA
ncbi:ImmA/IrrE family metallo-endopeptidase [Fulvivirga sp. 29W222]|uniref:ImmA/IrrE family metallo-endopeptidase n=1 Tax=Fulvivirga marina TaxID=2494733 RepID=A0A937FX89_9BACT|nr:ImmA/IrrE family metallo-endopeptidase [Fulvivirga marina]MBL6446397.1 ImmA/IrrE family metallo-endopeptidase [Fulvivirga marina]